MFFLHIQGSNYKTPQTEFISHSQSPQDIPSLWSTYNLHHHSWLVKKLPRFFITKTTRSRWADFSNFWGFFMEFIPVQQASLQSYRLEWKSSCPWPNRQWSTEILVKKCSFHFFNEALKYFNIQILQIFLETWRKVRSSRIYSSMSNSFGHKGTDIDISKMQRQGKRKKAKCSFMSFKHETLALTLELKIQSKF